MSKRLLIADDAAFIREIIKVIAKDQQCIVVGEAEDGEETLSKCELLLPDILFLDLVMPKISGLEVLKLIRPQYPKMKIIICSTLDDMDFVSKIDPGLFDAKLSKPFQKEDVVRVLV